MRPIALVHVIAHTPAGRDIALVVSLVVCAALLAVLVAGYVRGRNHRLEPTAKRVLFPFVGRALSQPVLDATLRLARAEGATLVPTFLARVPLNLPLTAPAQRQCDGAMPLLEAVEHRATRQGVPVDSRIERGRTYRHALAEMLQHERYDRLVVAADTAGIDGFSAADIAWLLEHADGEILVLRPGHDRLLRAAGEGTAGRPPELSTH